MVGAPKQTHGGDDDGSGSAPQEEPKKKISLSRFESQPDMNIRDAFWAIMAAYSSKGSMKQEIKKFDHSKTALVRIALGVLDNPESAYYGLSLNFTALYTLMMVLDGEWKEEFAELLSRSHADKTGVKSIAIALKKLQSNKEYREQLLEYLKATMLEPEHTECVLAYIAETKDKIFVEALKKEILIIAKTDVDMPQRYAMKCLSLIKDQSDVFAALAQLIMHWDEETRRYAAFVLKDAVDDTLYRMAKAQLGVETDEEIKKLLTKIIQKNEKNRNVPATAEPSKAREHATATEQQGAKENAANGIPAMEQSRESKG